MCNIVSSFSSHSLSHHFHRHQDCFHSDASHLRFTSLSLLPLYVSSDGVHIIIMRWKVQSWFYSGDDDDVDDDDIMPAVVMVVTVAVGVYKIR